MSVELFQLFFCDSSGTTTPPDFLPLLFSETEIDRNWLLTFARKQRKQGGRLCQCLQDLLLGAHGQSYRIGAVSSFCGFNLRKVECLGVMLGIQKDQKVYTAQSV